MFTSKWSDASWHPKGYRIASSCPLFVVPLNPLGVYGVRATEQGGFRGPRVRLSPGQRPGPQGSLRGRAPGPAHQAAIEGPAAHGPGPVGARVRPLARAARRGPPSARAWPASGRRRRRWHVVLLLAG
jgi:hypothetical protein